MFTLFNRNSDSIKIQCPSCGTIKSIQKSNIKNFENRRFIKCKCTCSASFNKKLKRQEPKEMDLISAIARLDFGVLWYKIQHPLAFLNG